MQHIVISVPDGIEVKVQTLDASEPPKSTPSPTIEADAERSPAKQAVIGKLYTVQHSGKKYTLIAVMENDAVVFYANDIPYPSPTAAAKAITGAKSISGPRFWGFE